MLNLSQINTNCIKTSAIWPKSYFLIIIKLRFNTPEENNLITLKILVHVIMTHDRTTITIYNNIEPTVNNNINILLYKITITAYNNAAPE